MIRVGGAEPDSSSGNFTYLSGIGRTCWARNWRGDWVCQVMHNFAVPVGPDDDLKRARFVDEILSKRKKA